MLIGRLAAAYRSVPIGDPLEAGTLVGPLIDKRAFEAMQAALAQATADGGTVHGGERVLAERHAAYYARPALVEMPGQTAIVCQETFAPILYAMPYETLDEALALHNGVEQGLASAIFTTDLREGRAFHVRRGQRLRHRQRQYRSLGGRDRRRLRRREGDRRRPRIGLRCVEDLYAARHPIRSITRTPCPWRRA